MRNLRLQGERRRALDDQDSKVVDVCLDGEMIAALSQSGVVVLSHALDDAPIWRCNLADVCVQNEDWFSLAFVDPFYVALSASGTIVSIQANDGVAELVGEFENGIQAAAWTNDILALVTMIEDDDDKGAEETKSVILTMNSQWDVLAEVPIDRIETDTAVRITWSSNADSIAVSSVDAQDGLRKIRLYNSESLELRAVGRTEDGSGTLVPNLQSGPIAWAGVGCSNLLVAIQKKGKRTTQVAFMEPNGLRHREFSLREEPGVVVLGLEWNASSDLLAVSLRNDNQQDKVQLWHRSNYHWYQKYEIKFRDAVEKVLFHKTDPGLLLVLLQNSRWIEYKFHWNASDLYAQTSFVTDGSKLNWTDFRRGYVPPPMYEGSLQLEAGIRELAFAPVGTKEAVTPSKTERGLAYLSSGCLVLFRRHEGSYSVEAISTPMEGNWSLRSLCIVQIQTDSISLVCVSPKWEQPNQDSLLELKLTFSGNGEATLQLEDEKCLHGLCLTMTRWKDFPDGTLIQMSDGVLLEYDSRDSEGKILPSDAPQLMEPCPWVEGLKDPAAFTSIDCDSKRLIVGMSERFRLYFHDILLADSVSSFSISLPNEFLTFVTAGSRCILRFLPLQELCSFDPLLGVDDNSTILQGYEPRNVERGSRLVAVLSNQPTTVLQMPRGNLEVVSPRALVLRHVMVMCSSQNRYRDAFLLMRRQKVDLNLLVDLDPTLFVKEGGVHAFVDQVRAIDHVNLFISSLQDFDSTCEKYNVPSWLYRKREMLDTDSTFDFSNKVNQVCESIRDAMVEAEATGATQSGRKVTTGHFLLPILSTFAKENPPQLDKALSLIRSRNSSDDTTATSSKRTPLFSQSAQNAIQYLALLADYKLLFETALSTYDYEMARAVARNSQMDPKVYLPLLRRYMELPQYFGRYEVDLKLKRYELALRNLSKSGSLGERIVEKASANEFESCMEIVEEHQLHEVGLELFGEDPQRRKRILFSLGDHLMKIGKPEAALSVFSSAEDDDKSRSIEAAKQAMNWRVLFSILPREEHEVEARVFVDRLVVKAEGMNGSREMLVAASQVLLDYTSSHAQAIDLLLKARKWEEAKRIAVKVGESHYAVKKVIDAAVSYSQSCLLDFEERSATNELTSQRFRDVLAIRKQALLSGEANLVDTGFGDDTGSQFSLASNTSNLSMQSGASVSSVASLSSVISVKSNSSFTVTTTDHGNRHKSRFNEIGREQKKKPKKKQRRSRKARRGSEEELQELVQTLRTTFVNDMYRTLISETIIFLTQNNKSEVARALYEGYKDLSESLKQSSLSKSVSGDGQVLHPCETQVASMKSAELPDSLQDLFASIPSVL